MGCVLIDNIEILYDEYDEEKISRIRKIINSNSTLLVDKNSVHILEFDAYFKKVATCAFTKNSKFFSDKDFLSALYITSLSRDNPEYKNAVVKLGDELSDDLLYSLIAYKYYEENGTMDDFIQYLMDRRDTSKIVEWLYQNYRWDTRNYLIEVVCSRLKEFDSKLYEILPDLVNKFLLKALQVIFFNDQNKVTILPDITHEKLDELFCDFLDYIKAPQEWMDTYLELKQGGKIVFVEFGSADSECIRDTDGRPSHLIIEDDGTVDIFYTLIHEFIHYVSLKRGFVPFSILEFPSVFFEKMASRFLKIRGYSKDTVDAVIKMRDKNNAKIYMDSFPVLATVNDYIKNGYLHVSNEDMVKGYQENLSIIHELREKIEKSADGDFFDADIFNVDASILVDNGCDSVISSFVKNGPLAIDGCQYIVGTYLANGVLDQIDTNPRVVSQMIQVTDRLFIMNLDDILTLFDMEDLFSKKSDGLKEFVKIKEKSIENGFYKNIN